MPDPHREVETPCFVKDTVKDGFFGNAEKSITGSKTAVKKRNHNRINKDAIDTQSNTKTNNLKKLGSERESMPFAIAELESCEDSLTAVGDSMDTFTTSHKMP